MAAEGCDEMGKQSNASLLPSQQHIRMLRLAGALAARGEPATQLRSCFMHTTA
jgi:hypothetical protein